MALDFSQPPFEFLRRIQKMREQEDEQAKSNPFLAKALEREKMEGHRIAFIARTVALSIVLVMLPFLNPHLNVLFYVAIVLIFILLGWLQYRQAQVGYSRNELFLIFADVALMTLVLTLRNPFLSEEIPSAVVYRFDNFIYFFVILSVATLAYSWRTVWAIGTWVGIMWLGGFLSIIWFGHQIPGLSEAAAKAFSGHEIVTNELDPNGVQPAVRVQEIVVFIIVAGILAVKGWRTNNLLMQQADIAAERANLSRYFPSSLVDVLASTDHDIGAVRSQNVAVLFTDIVGFTEYAEQHTPEEVMTLLREYHAFIERAIFQNNGTLDKYLGDGVMATFGTPETGPEDASNALNAAQQIMQETKALNAEREAQGLPEIHVSIGLHYGPVILGDIGPSRRLEFAVLGDTVNVASRLEAQTRELKCQCVVSDDLMRQAGSIAAEDDVTANGFSPKNKVTLRGRQNAIDIWVA